MNKLLDNITKTRIYKSLKVRQYVLFTAVILGILVASIMLVHLTKSNIQSSRQAKSNKPPGSTKLDIELATNTIKGDQLWHNHLEEKITQEQKLREKQLNIINESLLDKELAIRSSQDKEFEEIKARLSFTLRELERIKNDNVAVREDLGLIRSNMEEVILPADIDKILVANEYNISSPVSNFNYIPATSYITGHLLGGIVVSTSVNSVSQPVPVVIRLTDFGNLPEDFAVDIKECRLLASAYGDISSERAIIRAEELVCENKFDGLLTSTKVAGVIYGDDGMNGIRGSVVSMSDKHLKNAFLGGVLSGFSKNAKPGEAINISPIGTISNTAKKGFKDRASDSLLQGSSTAAEKLADYHIRLAENISPVILIPGGSKVDVMFTKGVYIGSSDVQDKISNSRNNSKHNNKQKWGK